MTPRAEVKRMQAAFREASDTYQQLMNDIIFLKAQNENLVATNKKLSDQIAELKRGKP